MDAERLLRARCGLCDSKSCAPASNRIDRSYVNDTSALSQLLALARRAQPGWHVPERQAMGVKSRGRHSSPEYLDFMGNDEVGQRAVITGYGETGHGSVGMEAQNFEFMAGMGSARGEEEGSELAPRLT